MDDEAQGILQRILRRVPSKKTHSILREWGCLSAEQLEDLDYTQPKWLLLENLFSKCQESRLRLKDILKLEMVYHIENPNQGTWHALKLSEAEDEALTVDFVQFKQMFVAHLEEVVRHVSISIKKVEEDAVWIRIAWGDNFTKPNHLKPTYAVHYLQTPYVFVLNLATKHKPFLYQALALSTRHASVNDAQLTGRSLTAMRDLLMKHFQQVFPNQEINLKERNAPPSHPSIDREHAEFAERTHQMACEAFGDGTVPKLETAVYKVRKKNVSDTIQVMTLPLETRYKGSNTLSDRDELFRGVVKFSSPNLLESLRHCVSTRMAESPVTPLLSSITQKGRNHFVISEKSPGGASQTPAHRT